MTSDESWLNVRTEYTMPSSRLIPFAKSARTLPGSACGVTSKYAPFALFALCSAAFAAGAAASPPSPAAVIVSTHAAGARPVALTVSIRTELQCGRLPPGTLTLRLPLQARVPTVIAPAAVLVGGRRAARVSVAGHALSIATEAPAGIVTCESIAIGTAKIVVTAAAKLGNPRLPGSYPLAILRRGEAFVGRITVG